VEGFTWGCPSMPSAADLAGSDRILVAAESVMSQQAADLAPGTAVEYRSREAYLIGGWFRATICQVLKSDQASAPQDAKASETCLTQHLMHSCAVLHVSLHHLHCAVNSRLRFWSANLFAGLAVSMLKT